ncbi:hypothetical protein FHX52_4186 [Humibacillus xanthopallidus]|uniref:Uncharacterized protein n=1 Tax=Humibacillus xanthopallidus TaxID=412689 RepID=A0A543PLL3_9MICO|nr:hypothetical protein FHX52_4186 [Humibacillus xanthopallidus]
MTTASTSDGNVARGSVVHSPEWRDRNGNRYEP